jgi:hypothetical protein
MASAGRSFSVAKSYDAPNEMVRRLPT